MKIKFEQLELNLAMDEEKIIQKEKDAGIPVVGILKRKSRKPAMAAKKKTATKQATKILLKVNLMKLIIIVMDKQNFRTVMAFGQFISWTAI